MMKQNLSSRLAAGGIWALHLAQQSVEAFREMREAGVPNPALNRSDTDVFTVCGVGAFQLVVNANMEGMRMQMKVQLPSLCYDAYGMQISREQWQQYRDHPDYKRVGMWISPDKTKAVSTVWTGVDTNSCQPPHIFQSVVISGTEGRVLHTFSATNLIEAHDLHREVVAMVKAGKL